MSCDHTNTCSCGCCEGVEVTTPLLIDNEAGLSEVAFRVGTHGSFKKSMLAGISGSTRLKDFTSRKDDDPGIALTDAWAVVLDVLTFYQARIIQEGFLRTSIERLSLVELARHISYKPKPGVAAGVWLSSSSMNLRVLRQRQLFLIKQKRRAYQVRMKLPSYSKLLNPLLEKRGGMPFDLR